MTRVGAVSMLLGLLAAVPITASAHSDPPPPTLATNPEQRGDPGGWHLLFGHAYCDTVSAGKAQAVSASEEALRSDHWVFQANAANTHLLSDWKAIHHILFRLFSGKAFGRIFIDVTPLTGARSVIRFQGVLATRRDIEHNPARGWAERSYASAVRRWEAEVREDLARP